MYVIIHIFRHEKKLNILHENIDIDKNEHFNQYTL